MLAHNEGHWIQVQKLPVVHILQHLRPLSWVLRPGYHSELTLGNVIISVISFYHPVGIYHLLWAIFNVHSVDGFHEVIVDFQCLLIRTKLLAKLRFYQRSKKWGKKKGDLELLRDWQGELEERSPSDASLCRFRAQSEQKDWYSSGRTCCDNQVNVIHPPVWGDNFCIGRFPP